MICVPESVNKLFPELDLSSFKGRNIGYGVGELALMIPKEFIIEPLYVNRKNRVRFKDIKPLIRNSGAKVPIFFFTKTHCFLEYYDIKNKKIGEHSADIFFSVEPIYKVVCLLDYNTRRILAIK